MSPRPPRTLQTFSVAGDDVPLTLARAWAESTSRQLEETKGARRRYHNLDSLYERMDGDVEFFDVEDAFRSAWTAEALLVLSASHLESWTRQLYHARGRRPPQSHPHLRALRNAVEHLDEANIDEETWVATPRTAQSARRGIGALPGGELLIGFSDDDRLFGVITHAELEQIVESLLGVLRDELDDYARDWLDMVRSGR